MSFGNIAALVLAALVVGGGGAQAQSDTRELVYPPARRSGVAEHYFGTRVSDPYRWMEELDSPELAEWLSAQEKLTSVYMARLPLREHFQRRIEELWNYPRTTLPVVEDGKLFYRRNSGLQPQSVLFMRSQRHGAASVVLDPNALSPDGSISLANYSPSPDGRYLAYTLSRGGSDWQTVRVRELSTGRDLADEVEWMRFSRLSWTRDGKGFFYSRFPRPPSGQELNAALKGHALYYHRVGTPQSQDVLVHRPGDISAWSVIGWVTEDGRYLIVRTAPGAGPKNRLYYADLRDARRPDIQASIKPLIEDDDAEYYPIGNIGPLLYVRTDRGASNRKIIRLDLRDPGVRPTTIVAERKEPIRNAQLIGGRLVIEYLAEVQSRLELFDPTGRPVGMVDLPARGTVLGIRGREDAPEIFYAFTSPLHPNSVHVFDPRSGTTAPFESPAGVPHGHRYESRQLYAVSKDGTRIPFTLTSRKDIARDGNTPTLLLGYGGFGTSLMPSYRPHVIAWLEAGGAWVTANIRGGGEYGDAWHNAARGPRRQTAFDDFIAVAQFLVAEKYTSRGKLGILGTSNGGLLVAAVSQQRPELFSVALPHVGVMDLLRYDKFTGGRAWIREYGSPADPELFAHLMRISPLHNTKTGGCYPATLVTTADHDDRVVPSHSFKYVATLQAAQGCDRPVMLRVERNASHGYRATAGLIRELADRWAFAAQQMGMMSPAP